MKFHKFLFLIAFVAGLLIFTLPYLGIESPETSYTTFIKTEYSEDPLFSYAVSIFPIKVEVLNAEQLITNDSIKIGVAGQMNEMHFGRIPVGASTTKILEIENNEGTSAKAIVEVVGPMRSFTAGLDIEKLLPPGEKSEIKIKCEPASSGNYTGEVIMTVISPKSSFSEQLLKLM
ncbi:MAG: hypothetical protein JW716_05745 [Candidatus Aenigmarchaeota archaeon]|nr:hypothetical protein [Candidatus Aenigmarchaeota archaeon]